MSLTLLGYLKSIAEESMLLTTEENGAFEANIDIQRKLLGTMRKHGMPENTDWGILKGYTHIINAQLKQCKKDFFHTRTFWRCYSILRFRDLNNAIVQEFLMPIWKNNES